MEIKIIKLKINTSAFNEFRNSDIKILTRRFDIQERIKVLRLGFNLRG